MSLVLAAEFGGIVVFGLPGGKLPAVLGARRAMLASDLIRGGLTALIPLLAWTDALSLPLLLVIVFASGAFFGAYQASQRLLLSEIAANEQSALIRGGGFLGSVNEAASFAGPAIGGVLIALTGPTAVLLFDAASYLVAFGIILAFVHPGAPLRSDTSATGLFAGVRFLTRDPLLGPLAVSVSVLELAWSAMFAALPVLAFREFGGSVNLAGWFLAAYGGGSLAGGLIAVRSASRIDLRIVTPAIGGVAVAMWALALPLPAWGVVIATATTGVFTGLFFPPLMAELTLRPPEPIRAQVLSAATTAFSVTGPLGYIAAGLLLERYRTSTPTFVMIGAIATVATGLSVIARVRGERKEPAR
jgi:predicted MFS family arabinose efflux permease